MTKISELIPDAKNARAHNPRNVGMIVNALHEVGAARSIVIDEDGNILAGNATIEAAAEAGIENVEIIEADGETIIAVRRTGLTDEQKTRLKYFDNQTAAIADWDPDVILADLEAGFDFDEIFSGAELENLTGAAVRDYSELDDELASLEGFEEVGIIIVVPMKFKDEIEDWLANGEVKTGPGLGKGVMKHCGLP